MSRLMDGSVNFKAYDAVEAIDNFSSEEEIAAYRKRRIDRYAPVVSFITKRSPPLPSSGLSVVEVGSGSSALLYALAEKACLGNAVGIELSRSRFEFAEGWKADAGYDVVRNVNQNFIDVDLAREAFDWFVVIDNTFTYLHPEDQTYPGKLLQRAFASLRDGGCLLLDFINYAKRDPDVEMRQWNAFPKTDPFSYALYSTRISDGINITETIFIKRDGGAESIKVELSKVYGLADLESLLGDNGFRVSEVYSGFEVQPYQEKLSERLLVVAVKSSDAGHGTS